MRRPSLWRLWLLPLVLAPGCLLPSFENVPNEPAPQGGTNSGGAPLDDAGAGGEIEPGGSANGGAGGAANVLEAVPDQYVVPQGETLTVAANLGLLANDSPVGVTVTSFAAAPSERAAELDAVVEIESDGALSFAPAADFFGRYVVDYVVEDDQGQAANGSVSFIVQPTAATLDVVEQGVGGVLFSGSGREKLGTTLSALGDVNGDGLDDFAIGAPGSLTAPGAVFVIFGSPDLAERELSHLSSQSTETSFAVLEGQGNDQIGAYIASAGFFDGDALPDLLVGSPKFATNDGALFVAYGAQLQGLMSLNEMSAAQGFKLAGVDFQGQRLGAVVAGGGDFNGDAQTDLLAGVFQLGTTVKGLAVITEAKAQLAQSTVAIVEDDKYDLPLSAAFVGDVNGDGNDDVLASSQRYIALFPGDANAALVPAIDPDVSPAYKYARDGSAQGAAPVAAAGDVNGDSKQDFAYCDQVAGQATCQIVFGNFASGRVLSAGDWAITGFGSAEGPLLANAQDLNHDEFSDLLVADENGAYIVFGKKSGFGDVDASSLGSDGFSLSAPAAGGITSVATVGDVNGDGFDDVAIGVADADGGDGRVYVVFGGPFSSEQR